MGVWAEDVQEIEVPQVVDEVQKADFGDDHVEFVDRQAGGVHVHFDDVHVVVVDDVHVEYEKAKAEVEWNVEVYKTETVFLLAEGNDVLGTASSSFSDHTGCRSSMAPTDPNPAELVDPLAATAHRTFSGRRCSMIFGSDCSSSLVFCICSCSFPVVLK